MSQRWQALRRKWLKTQRRTLKEKFNAARLANDAAWFKGEERLIAPEALNTRFWCDHAGMCIHRTSQGDLP